MRRMRELDAHIGRSMRDNGLTAAFCTNRGFAGYSDLVQFMAERAESSDD